MKYLITLIAGYLLPSVAPYINVDVCLGILTGVLFGLLVAMIAIGPTPKAVTPKVNRTVRKPRRIIEQAAPKEWTFTPVNYEWSAA